MSQVEVTVTPATNTVTVSQTPPLPEPSNPNEVLSLDSELHPQWREVHEVPSPPPVAPPVGTHWQLSETGGDGSPEWVPNIWLNPDPQPAQPGNIRVLAKSPASNNFWGLDFPRIQPYPSTGPLSTLYVGGGTSYRWSTTLPEPAGQPANHVPVTNGSGGATYQPYRPVPTPPPTGNWVLTSSEGMVQWVAQ